MSRYHIVEDSVAGDRCFIVYDHANSRTPRPVITIWHSELDYDSLQTHLGHHRVGELQELGDLVRSVQSLGGDRDSVRNAVNAWFKEKGWLKP